MKVFLGIDLSDKFTQEVISWQQKNSQLPVRFTPPTNLHITLVPPWYADGKLELISRLRRLDKSSFGINFDEIAINMDSKVVWTEPSRAPFEIVDLQAASFDLIGRMPETRSFVPHVTLARFKKSKQMKDILVTKFAWREQVNNVTLFQSVQTNSGVSYNKLYSLKLY